MKVSKVVFLVIFVLIFLPLFIVNTKPAIAETLGPPVNFYTTQGRETKISSPENKTYYESSVLFKFLVSGYIGIFNPRVGDFGYSLDEGEIARVADLTLVSNVTEKEPLYPQFNRYHITYSSELTVANLSNGKHALTVYFGWQYPGIPENPSLKRYEIFDFSVVHFTVVQETVPQPEPQQSEPFPTTWIEAAIIAGVCAVTIATVYFVRKRKK